MGFVTFALFDDTLSILTKKILKHHFFHEKYLLEQL